MTMRRLTVLIAAGAALLAPAAAGAKSDSAYTDLTYEADAGAKATCKGTSADEETGSVTFECKGRDGIKVYIAEGDLRTYVSYGWNAKGEIAYGQTFPMFNQIGDKLEWRLKDGKPVATILRWKMSADGKAGEVLVVTQLEEGNSCWIARVSASKNKNANELARKAADELAGTVDCSSGTPPKDYGDLDDEDIQPR
ncbi:MAG: hypothetical protein QM698_06320 [Micropepsaceae bacterium]